MAAEFYIAGWIVTDQPFKNLGSGYVFDSNDVFIALFAIMMGAQHAGMAQSFGPDMGKANAAATRIFGIKEYPSAIDAVGIDQDTTKASLDINSVKGKIEFKNVWFRYPTRKTDFVLKGLNICIQPGESVALVGESGCGKSTFVNLMMRFYDVDQGEILLDDKNIKDINLHDLRQAVSLVMQEPVIFNYSILENILYSKLNASNEEVMAACKTANAMDFINANQIKSMDDSAEALLKEMETYKDAITVVIGKKKYDEELLLLKKLDEQDKKKGTFQAVEGDIDTRDASLKQPELTEGFNIQCGIRGSKLSGGQKQRCAIARTIIRQPKILLLDEATSALDEDSQKKVQEALENAMVGRTTIIIAHRLSTIEKCNKIFVLDQGKVAEEGGFSELKAKGGKFSNIANAKGKAEAVAPE